MATISNRLRAEGRNSAAFKRDFMAFVHRTAFERGIAAMDGPFATKDFVPPNYASHHFIVEPAVPVAVPNLFGKIMPKEEEERDLEIIMSLSLYDCPYEKQHFMTVMKAYPRSVWGQFETEYGVVREVTPAEMERLVG